MAQAERAPRRQGSRRLGASEELQRVGVQGARARPCNRLTVSCNEASERGEIRESTPCVPVLYVCVPYLWSGLICQSFVTGLHHGRTGEEKNLLTSSSHWRPEPTRPIERLSSRLGLRVSLLFVIQNLISGFSDCFLTTFIYWQEIIQCNALSPTVERQDASYM